MPSSVTRLSNSPARLAAFITKCWPRLLNPALLGRGARWLAPRSADGGLQRSVRSASNRGGSSSPMGTQTLEFPSREAVSRRGKHDLALRQPEFTLTISGVTRVRSTYAFDFQRPAGRSRDTEGNRPHLATARKAGGRDHITEIGRAQRIHSTCPSGRTTTISPSLTNRAATTSGSVRSTRPYEW